MIKNFKDFITNYYVFTILCCFITFLFSQLSNKINNKKESEKETFINFYNAFETLWDQIHQGRAFNYSDLSLKDQERIVYFFIENKRYATKEINDYIYVLKTCRLNNFNNNDPEFIKECDDAYNKLIDMMVNKFDKLKKKYR